MNGISIFRLVQDQFYSKAPPAIARPGWDRVQIGWLIVSAIVGTVFVVSDPQGDVGAAVLAANAVFTALSVTMAMFFWPRAINVKSDKDFMGKDERWNVYRLTTQLFWTVMVGILATGLAIAILVIPESWGIVGTVIGAISVALTAYQVLLLAQSVARLYAATYWMPHAR